MNSVGNKYTIGDLRKMLLKYPKLKDTYLTERKIIDDALKEIEVNEIKYKECTDKLKKKSVKTSLDKEEYKEDCKIFKENVTNARVLLEPFIDIKDLDTFKKYKDYILENKCWAKEWSIEHIENMLNIKVIIFNQYNYEHPRSDNLDNVLYCTQSEVTDPIFYILANYVNNNHYQLIYFKDTLVFKFNQLPYILRSKIMNRCIIGKDNSSWNKLVDFKNFDQVDPKTAKTKPDSNPCKGLSEEECVKKVEDCDYRKGTKRQYCAKTRAKK